MPTGKRTRTKKAKNVINSSAEKLKFPENNWQQEEFFKHCEINSENVINSKLSWEELAAIHDDHCTRIKQLDTVSKYIAERLREMPRIHSVRSRVKDSRNLVRKIIRKRITEESRDIHFNNSPYAEK